MSVAALFGAVLMILGSARLGQAQATTQASATRKPIRFQRPAPPGAPPGEKTAVARGDDEQNLPQPVLFAEQAAPGLTISPRPVLWFYIARPTGNKAVVTLSDTVEQQTIARIEFASGFVKAGIYKAAVPADAPELKPGIHYQWTVSVTSRPGDNSHNAVSLALMRYTPMPELQNHVRSMQPADRAARLAENAIWFDTIAAVCEGIEANPDDAFLREQRTSLLVGQGKADAARYQQPGRP
jgi:hypothetical protein